MATLTLTLDELVPVLLENLPDPHITDISAQLDELRAILEVKILGKMIRVPVAIRFVDYTAPKLTLKIIVESKLGKGFINQLLQFFIPEKELQDGITVNGETVILNLNELLEQRHIPFVVESIEPIGNTYQIDFKLTQHLT